VIVSSVSFANKVITQVDSVRYDGFSGVFNVTPESIMLASAGDTSAGGATGKTSLQYIDISDPGGAIVARGSLTVDGMVNGWGADNGRWNLDFADGKTAHVIGQAGGYLGGYTLSTPISPIPIIPPFRRRCRSSDRVERRRPVRQQPALPVAHVRYYNNSGATPFRSTTSPTDRAAAGRHRGRPRRGVEHPAGARLAIFALGNDYGNAGHGDAVTLHYLDVTDPARARARYLDVRPGLGVDPGCRHVQGVHHGRDQRPRRRALLRMGLPRLHLQQRPPARRVHAHQRDHRGPARTKGWVERGIFVGNRLISLSDVSLAVIDYGDPMKRA